MYMYNKQGDEAYVEKEQVPAMVAAGWTKEPPTAEEPEKDVEVEDAEVEVKVEKSTPKKIIRK